MNEAQIPSLARLDREIGLRGSFYDFVRMAWPQVDAHEFVEGWHVELICDVLERVLRGELRKVVINVPPTCMKSMLVSVFWPVWSWIRDPRLAFLSTSFDVTLTRRDAGRSLALVQSEWFRERWGDLVYVDESAGIGDHKNSRGGWRYSTSVGSKATGRHPDVRIIDDPTKPKDVSPLTLEAAEAYWNNTLRTRQRDPKTSRTVLIMQRLAVRDLAGVFEDEGDWHFVVLPMRYEPQRAYADDPRRTEGELLWPARLGEEEVKELERMPSRDRAAQLQQRPVPEGGAIIKREWIQWYDPAKAPRFFQRIQSWDLTFKDTKGSHFVAGQVWGVFESSYYLIDAYLERLDFVASCQKIIETSALYPGCGILIEDKANGPAVMSMLETKLPGLVPVEPKGGKDSRLNAVSPLFEGRNVFLPLGHAVAETLATSLVTFPVGTHDDDVDACTQALTYLHEGAVDYAAAMRAVNGRF